jgi:hypothetical protein
MATILESSTMKSVARTVAVRLTKAKESAATSLSRVVGIALALTGGLVMLITSANPADAATVVGGSPYGPVSLIDTSSAPGASCRTASITARGPSVWARDNTAGVTDWQWVRYQAWVVDMYGSKHFVGWSPWTKAYDNYPAVLPNQDIAFPSNQSTNGDVYVAIDWNNPYSGRTYETVLKVSWYAQYGKNGTGLPYSYWFATQRGCS